MEYFMTKMISISVILLLLLTGLLIFSSPATAVVSDSATNETASKSLQAELAKESVSSSDWNSIQAWLAGSQYYFTWQRSPNFRVYRLLNSAIDLDVAAEADLSLEKNDKPDSVRPNQTLTYILSVSNAGPDSAENIQVSDILPGGVTYQSAVGTDWRCIESSGTVTCTRRNLAMGSTSDITITVIAPSSAGTITNNAEVTSATTDPDINNNSASEETTVAAEADLSLEMSDVPDPALPGAYVVYTLSVSNAGPDSVENVHVIDMLPYAGYAGYESSLFDCSEDTGWVYCDYLYILRVGETQDIIIWVEAPNSEINLTNTAWVSSDATDPNTDNNADTEYTTVAADALADLSLDKSASADTVKQGETLTYTLTVSNAGPRAAPNITMFDTLPPGMTYLSANGTDWSCVEKSSGTVKCTRSTLAPSTTTDITIIVTATSAEGMITNEATAFATITDPNNDNNTDSVTVFVAKFTIYLPIIFK